MNEQVDNIVKPNPFVIVGFVVGVILLFKWLFLK